MKTQGQFLHQIYSNLKKSRPRFSKRAFAKYLNMPAPRLHDFMMDKRLMTLRMAEAVSNRLKLSEEEKTQFLNIVNSQRDRTNPSKSVVKLTREQFEKVSDWYYFAILALADTVDFNSDPEWVAQRLNLSKSQAEEALNVLCEVGFLKRFDDRLLLSHTEVETETDVPCECLRDSHKQTLRRTIEELDKIDVNSREIQSVTFAGDINKLKLVKKLIYAFTQKVVVQMESGHRSEVFELNVQLLPISKRIESNSASQGFD